MSDRVVQSPFEASVPRDEPFNRTLWTSLEQHASKLALVELETGRRATYADLLSEASRVARRLLSVGCQSQDVVAIFSPNSITWIVVYLAVCRIGAVPAAIKQQLTPDELQQQLLSCEAKFVFTTTELKQSVHDATRALSSPPTVLLSSDTGLESSSVDDSATGAGQHPDHPLPSFESLNIAPDDPATIFFSNGTMGTPKPVLMSHRGQQQLLSSATHPTVAILFPVQLVISPFSHLTGGLVNVMGIAAGYTTLIMAQFKLQTFLETIDSFQVQAVLVVTPIGKLMLNSPLSQNYALRSLKHIMIGAAPVGSQLEDQLMLRFPGLTVNQKYAMTEATFIASIPFDDDRQTFPRKPGSVGVPVPGNKMKVVDMKTGASFGPGERGEICVKSPLVMLKYMNNPAATAASIDCDGWLHTGDYGYYDEDGYFYVTDRLRDLMECNGHQVPPGTGASPTIGAPSMVAPSDLETVLVSHPEVSDAGVIGLPDAEAGELPLAWVVKKPNSTVTEAEIQQFVDERVEAFRRLRGGVRFVESVPRSPAGKMLRRVMRDSLLSIITL